MKSTTAAAWAAPTALMATLLLAGCNLAGSNKSAGGGAREGATAHRDPLEVQVSDTFRAQLRTGDPEWAEVATSLNVPGRVEADETRLARAGSPVAGRIAELMAVQGQSVRRGQVLATLNSTELSEGQFGFLKAQSQAQLAQRAAARARQLVEAGVISVAELQRREADYAQASAEFTTWHERLRVLGMSEEAAEALEKTRRINSLSQVVANIDGVVLERNVTPGQVVQPADTLFLIADLSRVWLVADVPEQAAGQMAVGKALEADVPALPGRTLRGRLSFVSATVNPETRTIRVRMDLPNPDLLYKPAMLANIQLRGRPERKQVIPAAAVVREGNQDHVFVQTASGSFLLRPVSLGEEFMEKRVLAGGLKTGEKFVLDNAFHLNNERKRASLHGE
ncbi:MAG: efflux RND transporter periplasmic adaptor subunit [Acidobacteria bacterium]|nr:efflux RND transporter periplasmic adaptor subunit [Acidobacteriota bacterium]